MSRTKVINYKGTKIFFADYSNIKTEEEFTNTLTDVTNYIRSQPENSVYSLANFENVYFNMKISKKIQSSLKGNKKHVAYSAISGINGLLRIMTNGIIMATGRDLRVFETLDEAKEFLLEKSTAK